MLRGGFDKDEVLTPLYGAFLNWHNHSFGTSFSENDLNQTRMDLFLNVTGDETVRLFEEFYSSDIFRELKPFHDALHAIPKLKERGHTLFVISARPQRLHNHSRAWFDAYFANHFHDIHLVGNEGAPQKKAAICEQLKLDYFVDDNPHNCVAVAKTGIKVFMPHRPWNASFEHEAVTKFKTWRELLSRL